MGLLKISNELIEKEPLLLNTLERYFDSMEEIMREHYHTRRFIVQKEGLPINDTPIDCHVKRHKNGDIKIYWCGEFK